MTRKRERQRQDAGTPISAASHDQREGGETPPIDALREIEDAVGDL